MSTNDAASPAATDAFLSGQGIPVAPGEIEAELARLWGPSAERVGGPDLEQPHVTRVTLANLIVAGFGEGAARVGSTLETVLTRHPCRAIVLRRGEPGQRRVSAEVSALCHLPAPGLPQVCSERIALSAGPEALGLLPGTVLSLLEPDLPLVLWWIDDPRPQAELFRTLAAEAARLLPDLPDPEPDPAALRAALDPQTHAFGRDLAWFGIARWRELVAQFFDPPGAAGALRRLGSVEVVAETPGADAVPRAAAWIAAWLAGTLGWTPVRREAAGPDRIVATFDRPGGSVRVDLRRETNPEAPFARLRQIRLVAPSEDAGAGVGSESNEVFGLTRLTGTDDVRIELCSAGRCELPRLVHAAELDPARRVAAALESARDDPPYRRALPILFWLLEG